jgi:hypothetical protein
VTALLFPAMATCAWMSGSPSKEKENGAARPSPKAFDCGSRPRTPISEVEVEVDLCSWHCGDRGDRGDRGHLVISNLAMLPAVGLSASLLNRPNALLWVVAFVLTSGAMLSSILYHAARQEQYHLLDLMFAGMLLALCVLLLMMYCSLIWGCVGTMLFVVALGFFLFTPPSGASAEYTDHQFAQAHTLWHVYAGAAVLAMLYGARAPV